MKTSLSGLLLCLLLCVVVAGCSAVKLKTLSTPFSNVPAGLTLPEVRDAIAAGCRNKQWLVVEESDTQVVARIVVRGKHEATVAISYNLSQYYIKYLSSVNLYYREKNGQQRIHRSYNNWVHYLRQSIDTELMKAASIKKRTQQNAPGAVPESTPAASSAL